MELINKDSKVASQGQYTIIETHSSRVKACATIYFIQEA